VYLDRSIIIPANYVCIYVCKTENVLPKKKKNKKTVVAVVVVVTITIQLEALQNSDSSRIQSYDHAQDAIPMKKIMFY
jgi:hypothetical protein